MYRKIIKQVDYESREKSEGLHVTPFSIHFPAFLFLSFSYVVKDHDCLISLMNYWGPKQRMTFATSSLNPG